ncbi:hypothetical protein PENSTE_c011G01118 [Penicillium steckii]|uniref:Uncharacterized protein n=1 Tax=Penicillium steckii TaxID=303698 RepID=A0A1V6T6J3_9EURO|nr:hypothetical protein PENSTE_c011G01118 [Penicillium steckii]
MGSWNRIDRRMGWILEIDLEKGPSGLSSKMIGVVKMDDKVANFGAEQIEMDFKFGARAISHRWLLETGLEERKPSGDTVFLAGIVLAPTDIFSLEPGTFEVTPDVDVVEMRTPHLWW